MSRHLHFIQPTTHAQIRRKIATEIPSPIAIVLLGPDGEAKDAVFREYTAGTPGLSTGCMELDVPHGAKHLLGARRNVTILVNGDHTYDVAKRRQLVAKLRDMGARSVIGLYVRFRPPMHDCLRSKDLRHAEYLTKQEKYAPQAGEFDYFITDSDE